MIIYILIIYLFNIQLFRCCPLFPSLCISYIPLFLTNCYYLWIFYTINIAHYCTNVLFETAGWNWLPHNGLLVHSLIELFSWFNTSTLFKYITLVPSETYIRDIYIFWKSLFLLYVMWHIWVINPLILFDVLIKSMMW